MDLYKNSKIAYYIRAFAMLAYPRSWCRNRKKDLMEEAGRRKDLAYIKERVDYYNRLSEPQTLPDEAHTLDDYTYKTRKGPGVYYLDLYETLRFFPTYLRWMTKAGDVTELFKHPTIVKSRPIAKEGVDNRNSVILKLNKVRHFFFVKDPIPTEKKKAMVLFRGDVHAKPHRQRFLEMYIGHPRCDLRDTSPRQTTPAEWKGKIMSIKEQLQYKYIMALEGNDVASNLKWVMSSNSVAVMPRPTFETWFMEGKLKPGVHYIEIKPDFSDLMEKIEYYDNHPEEVREIVKNANEYVKQFADKKRERLIAVMVMQKYFDMTNGNSEKAGKKPKRPEENKKTGQEWMADFAYHLIYGIWYLFSLIPLKVLYFLSDTLFYFFLYKCGGYRKKIVRKNLESSFPEKTTESLRKLERDFYHWFCDYFVETIKLMTIKESELKKRMTFKGVEAVEECIRDGQSCAVYLGHYCNWEWITSLPFWTPKEAVCGQIYRPLENSIFDRLFLKLRGRFGAECIAMDEVLRKTVENRAKKRLTVIGFISDQGPNWSNIHHWCDFLNHDTPVFTGTERIARKFGQAVFYMEVSRKKRGYYEAEFKLLTRTPGEWAEHELTDRYFEKLEQTIRQNPPYWLWSHKRWKRTHEEFNRRFEVVDGKNILKK